MKLIYVGAATCPQSEFVVKRGENGKMLNYGGCCDNRLMALTAIPYEGGVLVVCGGDTIRVARNKDCDIYKCLEYLGLYPIEDKDGLVLEDEESEVWQHIYQIMSEA